jgi:predicted enzyme related to lactoylglutathione lyase
VVALGGQDLDDVHEYDEGTVMLMADPEGNEFCLVQHEAPGVLGPPAGA